MVRRTGTPRRILGPWLLSLVMVACTSTRTSSVSDPEGEAGANGMSDESSGTGGSSTSTAGDSTSTAVGSTTSGTGGAETSGAGGSTADGGTSGTAGAPTSSGGTSMSGSGGTSTSGSGGTSDGGATSTSSSGGATSTGGTGGVGGTSTTDGSGGAAGSGGSDAGGTAGMGGTAGSGGTAGTGGTGPTPVCPNGTVEEGEECDDGEATLTCSEECTACSPPTPTPILDQDLGACFGSSCVEGYVASNGQSLAQRFQVSQPGTLSRIDVYVLNQAADTTSVTGQLVDAGNDANLFSGASPAEVETEVIGEAVAAGETSYSWVQLDFSDQDIQLDPDRHYFIWLRMFAPFPSDPDLLIRWNMWNDMTVTDPYPGGGPFWCPGSTNSCQAEVQEYRDYAFRVRLTPEPPLCE